jgi:hypothetical protein
MGEPIDFNVGSIVVNGSIVEITMDGELAVIDLSPDMDKVAAQMGYWAHVWAAAVEEQENADAYYRAWRAKKHIEAAADPKKPNAELIKARVEAHPDFIKIKAGIARAAKNVVLAKGIHDSFGKKANVLQSKGAMGRMEYGATGMHTRDTRDEPRSKKSKPVEAAEDPRKSAVRSVFKKRSA